jgi:hypothetical protein
MSGPGDVATGAATGAAVGGVPGAFLGGGIGLLKWLLANSANENSLNAMNAGFDGASNTIKDSHRIAMKYLQPYLENAGQDYLQQRGLVQSGYYQTPYKSFQGQDRGPGQSFGFNPGQGRASFTPWQAQGGAPSFTPMGLPPRPSFQPPAPPQPTQPQPQGAPQGLTGVPAQILYNVMQREMQIPPPSATTPGSSPQNQGLMSYNPQTGQGNPLTEQGIKPADPRMPSLQDLYNIMRLSPWTMGQSGPLEGGMPRGGLI